VETKQKKNKKIAATTCIAEAEFDAARYRGSLNVGHGLDDLPTSV
jgi:hypothetical protein